MSSILEAIGNTPLVRLRRCVPANGAELWFKLEYRNPTRLDEGPDGARDDRGRGARRAARPGDTVVEYTGGSTGPALALVCRAKGYRCLIVIADCFTEERFQLMRALGAELDVVKSVEGRPKVTPQDIQNMVARAAELADRPGHYATDQFNNSYIRSPHYRDHLGREIWEQSRRPGYGVLSRRRDGRLADGRVGSAEAAWRLHPGARAGGVRRDHRRRARRVRDAGLGRLHGAALGSGACRPH